MAKQLSNICNTMEFNFICFLWNVDTVLDWPRLQLSSNITFEFSMKKDKYEWHNDKVKLWNKDFRKVSRKTQLLIDQTRILFYLRLNDYMRQECYKSSYEDNNRLSGPHHNLFQFKIVRWINCADIIIGSWRRPGTPPPHFLRETEQSLDVGIKPEAIKTLFK